MRLPVLGTLRVVFRNLTIRSSSLVRLLALPAILIVTLHLYIWNLSYSSDFDIDDVLSIVATRVLLLLFLSVIWALLAVSCHRILLDDPEKPTIRDGVWVGFRQLKYMAQAVVVALPIVFWGGVVGASSITMIQLFEARDIPIEVMAVILWAPAIPIQYLCSRIVLTLPAAAIHRNLTFAGAWSLSRGNGWRITALTLAAPAASKLLSLAFFAVLPVESIVVRFLWSVVGILVGIVTIACLSYSYEWITSQTTEENGSRVYSNT